MSYNQLRLHREKTDLRWAFVTRKQTCEIHFARDLVKWLVSHLRDGRRDQHAGEEMRGFLVATILPKYTPPRLLSQ